MMDIVWLLVFAVAVVGGTALAKRPLSRLPYFFGTLFLLVITLFLMLGAGFAGLSEMAQSVQESGDMEAALKTDLLEGSGLFVSIVNVVVAAIIALILARRFLDAGTSKWWALVSVVPYLGTLVAIVMIFVPAGTFGIGPLDVKVDVDVEVKRDST